MEYKYKKRSLKKIISTILIFVFLAYSLMTIFFNTKTYASQSISSDYNSLNESEYPGIKSMIASLKAQYPNWNFKILYTDLNWSDVISGEYQGHGTSPKNLVQKSANYQGEWICPICGDKPYDNGSWRCASEKAIAYMMDPRNSLNSSDIFQFEELTNPGCNMASLQSMTQGTFLQGHEQGILDTANSYNVNAYYIVARIIQEQGRNGSALVSGESGYYNAFNIGASGNSTAQVIANGLAYAQKKGWDTLEKSISGGISFVADNYIKQGQNTLYLQKFNVTTNSGGPYAHQYQQNIMAAQSEGSTLRKTYEDINSVSSSHTFIIPVYKNMPAQACARPSSSGSAIVGTDLVKVNANPSLRLRNAPNGGTTVGWLYKDEIVSRLEKATTKVAGTYWDKVQKADGTVGYAARETYDYEATYKLYLEPVGGNDNGNTGTENPPTDPNNPETPSTPVTPTDTEKVKIDNTTKTIIVKPEVKAQDILDAFGGTAKIVKADGSYLENEQSIIGTGYIVEDIYTVTKKGDPNGDGKIDSADLLTVQKHLLKVQELTQINFNAGDSNSDSKIDSADLLVIQKYLLGVSNIEI